MVLCAMVSITKQPGWSWRAGPHAADRVAAIGGHVDGCPGATLAADRPEVDHAVVEDTVIRRCPVASDGADLACRDGVRVIGAGVRTVERPRLEARERRGQRLRSLVLRGARERALVQERQRVWRRLRSHASPSG